jgi:hypothetical protein
MGRLSAKPRREKLCARGKRGGARDEMEKIPAGRRHRIYYTRQQFVLKLT